MQRNQKLETIVMLMMEKHQNNVEYNNIQALFLSQICFRRAWKVSYEKYWNIGFNAFLLKQRRAAIGDILSITGLRS